MDSAIIQPTPKNRPWLLIIGGVLALIALVLCGIGGFTTFGQAKEIAEATPITDNRVVQLNEGESLSVWSETQGNTCTVTAPSGEEVSDAGVGSQSVTWGDREMHRVMKVEAPQAGDHTVACSMPYVVGESVSWSGVAFAAVGGGLACISVILVVIGFVLWLSKRKR